MIKKLNFQGVKMTKHIPIAEEFQNCNNSNNNILVAA